MELPSESVTSHELLSLAVAAEVRVQVGLMSTTTIPSDKPVEEGLC